MKNSFTEKLNSTYGNSIDRLFSINPEFRIHELSKILDISFEQASKIIAQLAKIDFQKKFNVDDCLLNKFPVALITEYKILPLKLSDETIILLVCWPLEDEQIRWISISTGYNVEFHLGIADDILKFINERFGLNSESTVYISENYESIVSSEDEDAVVIKFVNDLIKRCILDRATDIHFEPQRINLMIRYRVDGDLIIARVPDNLKNFQSAIISRLKIMARLNISEKRRPQDGKILFKFNNETLDIRVSTLPTIYGESVSLRLLTDTTTLTSIDDIIPEGSNRKILKRALLRPYGIILVTGPTGSGKSTTLSACLREIRAPNKRLMTVEDPIEYEVNGVNQTQVNPTIGLTFANILRSILRQDPDVIMIGEIRDKETADIAIRASITGHLVLSTLHTNDSVGAITRLRDIGIEEFLLASAVKVVVAQRLVRKLCPHCAIKESFHKLPFSEVSQIFESSDFGNAFMPVGCEYCRGTGYYGRVGVFEFLEINEDIHQAIILNYSESQLRTIATSNGMIPLKFDLLEKIRLGITSIEESIRITEH